MTSGKICSVDGCGKPAKGRGWCAAHWWRWKNHGDPMALAVKSEKPTKCVVDGCENPLPARGRKGMCMAHYLRERRHGDVNHRDRAANGELLKWLEAHIDHQSDECLIWPFAIGTDGRGMMGKVFGTPQAHRVMCFLVNGEPPSDIHEAAHSCGNGHLACVHPGHLRWATPVENAADRIIHGTEARGALARAKLTENEVRRIRELKGSDSQAVIGEMFGVDGETIGSIHRGETWSWLT